MIVGIICLTISCPYYYYYLRGTSEAAKQLIVLTASVRVSLGVCVSVCLSVQAKKLKATDQKLIQLDKDICYGESRSS